MNGFVVHEIIVTEVPELVFAKLDAFVVVGAVKPVLRIPVSGLVIALLMGSGEGTVVVWVPKLEVAYFCIDRLEGAVKAVLRFWFLEGR